MPRLTRLQSIRAEGRRAATKEHVRLRTDLTSAVDVFEIIKRARIWLFFEPMPGLLGLYDRAGGRAPGILINRNHPEPLQRFTAAHEYGHYVLGHAASTDDERSILSIDDPNADQELAAQAFAAEFLMPMKLVNVTMQRLGLQGKLDALDASDVYRLSVRLGASFRATVFQLRTLKRLSRADAGRILASRPIDIKASLLGDRPDDLRWADVWSVGPGQSGQTLSPGVGDRIQITLPENPTTGYRWAIVEATAGLELVSDRFEKGDHSGRIGAGGERVLILVVREPGPQNLRLVLRRAWEASASDRSTFTIDLVAHRPEVLDRGPVPHQREFLLASGF